MRALKLCFWADDTPPASKALAFLTGRYGNTAFSKADVAVVLGGDGFMLQMLHKCIRYGKALYGMNCGTVGFLLNRFSVDDLPARVMNAEPIALHPLKMTAQCASGKIREGLAFNEVSLLRQSRQAAELQISVDGMTKLARLVCDGALVSTPAGSTAYNFSVHGPILPLTSNVLALTPVSAFRPRRWHGALLPETAEVTFDILDGAKRPVSAVADFTEIRNVRKVSVRQARDVSMMLLFDADYSLEDRVLNEQFLT